MTAEDDFSRNKSYQMKLNLRDRWKHLFNIKDEITHTKF
jgi:hypothetical protein